MTYQNFQSLGIKSDLDLASFIIMSHTWNTSNKILGLSCLGWIQGICTNAQL